jgi:hypothetical protein
VKIDITQRIEEAVKVTDRVFFAMFMLALLCAFMAFIKQWSAAVFPALMFFLIGFDALASAMSTGTAKTPKAVEGRSPASAAPSGETSK